MAAIKWDEEKSTAANAHRRLPEAAREYFAAGRELAAGGMPAASNLHPFRIETKRFRYTLEMFRKLYGKPLDEYLNALRKVQTYLGDINDCAATRALLLEAIPSPSPHRRKIERALDCRMDKLIADFLKYWREEFDSAAQEARWRAFLAQAPAPQPSTRATPRKSSTKRAISA